jgi:hypothetical protein
MVCVLYFCVETSISIECSQHMEEKNIAEKGVFGNGVCSVYFVWRLQFLSIIHRIWKKILLKNKVCSKWCVFYIFFVWRL